MLARAMLVAFAVSTLAGCAGSSASGGDGPEDDTDFDDLDLDATESTGVIRGLVVDDRITPLEGADVELSGNGVSAAATTDAAGRFGFDGLVPGVYFMRASLLNHDSVQATADVVAGVDDPPMQRILLTRLSTEDPFSFQNKFEGFIQCGYSVQGVISYLCLNDYEKLVQPDDVPPTMSEVWDNRGYVRSLDGNWSTIVYELTWEPTAQGTSPEMFVLVSFWNRTSSDAYARLGGGPPNVLLRIEVGEEAVGQQGCCDMIPPEGLPDLYAWAGIQTQSGGPPV